MSALRRRVLQELQLAGVTRREYVEYWDGRSDKRNGGEWHGDACGCHDDRCIGYHHDDTEDCGCFPVCLDEVLAARPATGGRARPGRATA
jgi:hypothetical protein